MKYLANPIALTIAAIVMLFAMLCVSAAMRGHESDKVTPADTTPKDITIIPEELRGNWYDTWNGKLAYQVSMRGFSWNHEHNYDPDCVAQPKDGLNACLWDTYQIVRNKSGEVQTLLRTEHYPGTKNTRVWLCDYMAPDRVHVRLEAEGRTWHQGDLQYIIR